MLVNWAEIFIAKIVPELSSGDAEAELGLQRGSSTAPGFQESFGCSQAASLLWALWDANRNANNGLEFFKNSNNLPTYRTFRFLLEKNDSFHLLSPEMGITERGSPGSPRGTRAAAALYEQTALCELPPLWHLFLRHYFWKADFSHSQPLTHWPSLPGCGSSRLQLHFSADTSVDFVPPSPILTTRISAWGCSRFYQCLKCFLARPLWLRGTAQRTSSPLEIAVDLFQS